MVINAPAAPAKPSSPSGVIANILSTSWTYLGLHPQSASTRLDALILRSEFIDPPRYRICAFIARRSV